MSTAADRADIVARLEQQIAAVKAQIVEARRRVESLEQERDRLTTALDVITETTT